MTPGELKLYQDGWRKQPDGSWRRPPGIKGSIGPPTLSPPEAPKKRKARRMPKAPTALNELENKFYAWLSERYEVSKIRVQAITLRLAVDTTYTPDFYATRGNVVTGSFYEVKGEHMWEDAWVKLKIAASMYPEFSFYFCELIEGEWCVRPMPTTLFVAPDTLENALKPMVQNESPKH